MPRKKAEVPQMTVRLPGRTMTPLRPTKEYGSPQQGTNNASRIKFGKQALKDWPLLSSRWAVECQK